MLWRTFLAMTGLVLAACRRLRGQSRSELLRWWNQQIRSTPFRSSEIMTADTPALVGILDSPDASGFARAKACQRLAVVGDDSAVPAFVPDRADAKPSLPVGLIRADADRRGSPGPAL